MEVVVKKAQERSQLPQMQIAEIVPDANVEPISLLSSNRTKMIEAMQSYEIW